MPVNHKGLTDILTVCVDCGKKNDRKHKSAFGIWMGNCDMCGKTNVPIADAAHDFGIYNNYEEKIHDLIQDQI